MYWFTTFIIKKIWLLGVSAYFCLFCHRFLPLALQQSWLISRIGAISQPCKQPLILFLPATLNGLSLTSEKAFTGQQQYSFSFLFMQHEPSTNCFICLNLLASFLSTRNNWRLKVKWSNNKVRKRQKNIPFTPPTHMFLGQPTPKVSHFIFMGKI